MKILVDFSQTVAAAVSVQMKDGIDRNNPDSKNLVKHVVLSTLLSLKKKFKGDLILCCDAKNYWRRTEAPWYKGHRKHKRKDATKIDWEFMFEILSEIKQELKENFPYMVLEVDTAEADDLIAILVKYFDENELVNTGLIDEPDDVVIVSTDGDMPQLQKYRNVGIWNNITKKSITTKNPKQYLIEHICGGDAGDNIPNICTGEQWSKDRAANESARQAPFKTARIEDFYKKGIDACLNENERINYKRNEKLIDFDFIPTTVIAKVLREYLEYEVKGSKTRVMNYLLKHKMKVLLKSATDF